MEAKQIEIDRLEMLIAAISDTMKGPLPNIERALLYEERKELRERIKQLRDRQPTTGPGPVNSNQGK